MTVHIDTLDGVAVWLPPGGFPWSTTRKLRVLPMLAKVGLIAPRCFPRFSRLGVNAEARHPSGLHWYLVVMGVRPERQGVRIGHHLLSHGLDRVDRDGLACYLETGDPRNVTYYRSFGFEIADQSLKPVPGGPAHVALRRPAADG